MMKETKTNGGSQMNKTWIAILTLICTILIVGTMAYTGTKLAQPKKESTYIGQSVMGYKSKLDAAMERTK